MPDLLTDKTLGASQTVQENLTVSDTFTFSSHLATFNEREIVFAQTRNRGELAFIFGSTHVLYLEQTRIINLRCTSSVSGKEAKKIRDSETHKHHDEISTNLGEILVMSARWRIFRRDLAKI